MIHQQPCVNVENTKIQESITDLLEEIFKKEPHYFYTNDSIVLFDITMRQVMRVHDDQVSLRHGLMTLLPLILDSIPLESPGGFIIYLIYFLMYLYFRSVFEFKSSNGPETLSYIFFYHYTSSHKDASTKNAF